MQDTVLRKKVGQLFAVGFHGLTPSPEIKSLIHDYGIGGIVLFKRNIRDAKQLQALTLALQKEARDAGHEHPLFIGIDQENGLVTRICPPVATQLPGPMALGATHSPKLAYEVGKATGEALGYFGINMNYAPVCDINSEPLNPVIGVRSPGDDPELVGRFASACAQGLREQGIVPSSKHFPGHGETAVDSHYGLPAIPKTRDQLERCELVPFRRTVAEGVESVMTAHIALPAIGDGKLPATLSVDAMNMLRKDMKYDGMIVTDCLEMDGIRATYGTEQGSVLALNAGSDSLMICHTHTVQMASVDKVCQAVQSGELSLSRLEEAYYRVTKLKRDFLNWDTASRPSAVGSMASFNEESAALAKEAYSSSATLVRSKPNTIPLPQSAKVAFLFPGANTPAGGAVDGEGLGRQGSFNGTAYGDIFRRHNQFVTEVRYGQDGLSTDQWSLVESADVVILTTVNARESPYQRNLGLELSKRARTLVSIAACNPYDFLEDQSVETYVATYEPTIGAFEAAADVIFGVSPGRGRLPVAPGKSTQLAAKVSPFDAASDMGQLATVWNAALPTYPLSAERLRILVDRKSGHHFVARVGPTSVGLCLAYTTENRDKTSGQIAALAVDPNYQGQGIGTALLAETRAYFRSQFGLNNLVLGSSFPRFWPGIPRDLSTKIQDFFVHRGFRLNPPDSRSVDLHQDIKNFQAPEKYITRAKERGCTFRPLQSGDHEECMAAQRRNFSTYTGWVEAYAALDPRKYPDSVMVAFDSEGKQAGWTLMLPPSSPLLEHGWAMPSLCGPKTGLIGCVGVDKDQRNAGIGLALLCHAIENMKRRGIEGVFVDWVSKDGWYEQVGFEVWRSYRPGEI